MRTALIAAAIAIAVLLLAPDAEAQSSYNSRCSWDDGVYACSSRTETARTVTTTLCASGGIDAACTSKTVEKPTPFRRGPATQETVRVKSGSVASQPTRRADPNLCGIGYRMGVDGCEPG